MKRKFINRYPFWTPVSGYLAARRFKRGSSTKKACLMLPPQNLANNMRHGVQLATKARNRDIQMQNGG